MLTFVVTVRLFAVLALLLFLGWLFMREDD